MITMETKPTVVASTISMTTNNNRTSTESAPSNVPKNNEMQADLEVVVINTTTTTKQHDKQKHVTTTKEFPRICTDAPLLAPTYEWHHYSNNNNDTTTTTTTIRNTTSIRRKRLLLAQYSAYGKYARLLELTAPINHEYARRWNHDLVILQGTTMLLPTDQNCTPPEERSRFNKVTLLQMALSKRDIYDQLLILDADAMMYDLDYDVTQLLMTPEVGLSSATTTQRTSPIMLVAQRVHHDYDPPTTWNINNGVMLWNLHHPLTDSTTHAWDQACRKGLPDNRPFRGDQFYLHQILKKDKNRQAALSSVVNEFFYKDGTVVKHFQRSKMFSWNDTTGLDAREERIQMTVDEMCATYSIEHLPHVNYTS